MEKSVYEEERKYLDFVNKCIAVEIDQATENLQTLKNQKVTYDDAKRGEQFKKEALMTLYASKIERLKQIVNSPYFGRMDFTTDNKLSKLYIGKTTITSDNNELAVIDWRSPISNMFYDSSVGKAQYVAPEGIIEGIISLKRQIVIEEGILKSILDTDLVTSDQILRKYLEVHAENKMKNIVASIQREQNLIIRKELSNNLIIQGVAGSGKTSVALHRIAYLIYNNNLDAQKFAIIGPNKYFLNYISSILPDLDTKNASEYTFDVISKDIIKEEKYYYENTNDELNRYLLSQNKSKACKKIKGTLQYKECLNRFLNDYFNACTCNGISFENIEIVTQSELNRQLNFNNNMGYAKSINSSIKYLSKKIKENWEDYYSELVKPLVDEMRQYSFEDPERDKIILKTDQLKDVIKKGCLNEFKKSVKSLLISPLNLYKLFLENIEKYISLDTESLNVIKDESLKLFKKKIIPYEDMPALCYLSLLYYGNDKYSNYKHVVVDEAQDYNLFQYDVLKQMFSKSTFSIFGDLAQSIYSYRSLSSWEELKNKIFNNNCEILEMLKSYRTTSEITNISNNVLRKLNLNEANPVIRVGKKVVFNDLSHLEQTKYYLKKLNEYITTGYKSIGIICKDTKEMQKVAKILDEAQIIYNYVTSNDTEYHGGISLLTSYLAKGLEFDAVIINDATDIVYDENSKIDMHLLYVACTRALHELEINYKNNLCKVFNTSMEKENITKKVLK